jgi:copper chaperone CopZ
MIGGANMANIKLRVTGMSCGHCQEKVEKALRKTGGVYSAVVDLGNGEAEVDFNDDVVTTGELVSAVQKAGYQAKLAG